MVNSASDIVLPTTKNIPKIAEMFDDLDIFTTAQHFHELNFLAMEDSESPKQISVDPISLRESSRRSEASFNLMLPPVVCPSPLLPLKPPNINYSLPNSAASSPRFSFALLKKKLRNESQASPRQIDRLANRHSSAHDSNESRDQGEINLRRSRSCAEGRTASPADELDLWFSKPNLVKCDSRQQENSKIMEIKDDHYIASGKKIEPNDDEFKCGILCMYLPGFGKEKIVKPKREQTAYPDIANMISRTVSLEKFECGSWASSAIINDHEDDSTNLFFDLPLELIRTSVSDATSPVTAAFVFDKDRKGVLKNGSTRLTARKSHESARNVRFSTSSVTSHPSSPASCITPRLRKAREDFNAFLEAQSA